MTRTAVRSRQLLKGLSSSGRRCSSHQYGCHFLVSFLSFSRCCSPPFSTPSRLPVSPIDVPPFAGKCLRTAFPSLSQFRGKRGEISIHSHARYLRHMHIMAQTAKSGEKRTVLAAKFLPVKSTISICSFIKIFLITLSAHF